MHKHEFKTNRQVTATRNIEVGKILMKVTSTFTGDKPIIEKLFSLADRRLKAMRCRR